MRAAAHLDVAATLVPRRDEARRRRRAAPPALALALVLAALAPRAALGATRAPPLRAAAAGARARVPRAAPRVRACAAPGSSASDEPRPQLRTASPSVFTGRWVDPDAPPSKETPPLVALGRALGEALPRWASGAGADWAPVRREWLRFLAGFDRGDFRWEFLVPFREEPLTRVDKFIVATSFVALALGVQVLFDREASVWDHLAYILFFLSYAIGNESSLRTLAIGGSALEIVANLDTNGPERADVVPVSYETLFIVINAYYALRAHVAAQPVEFAQVERRVYEACFEPFGLAPRQFLKILESAEWHVAVEGERLVERGEPVRDVFVGLGGAFSILGKDNQTVGAVQPYVLIGEVSLLQNLQSPGGSYHPEAVASMVAAPGATYVRWPQWVFFEAMAEDEAFAAAMRTMIARALSRKLLTIWEGGSAGGMPQPPPAAMPQPPPAASASADAGSKVVAAPPQPHGGSASAPPPASRPASGSSPPSSAAASEPWPPSQGT